jgi:class 3 adenylate cyclase
LHTNPSGTVTFLFTDVEGSTRLWELHTVDMRGAMEKHDSVIADAIANHGGVVFTTAGDQFCAAFSAPGDALAAALDSQRNLAAEDWAATGELKVRMALHTGNAVERDGDYFGPPLNRCARILSIGHGGQILVSTATAALLRDVLDAGIELTDLGAHTLKDLEREEHVFQVDAPGLATDFPELDSRAAPVDGADKLSLGRQAHASERWSEAYDALFAASQAFDLDAEDLQRLGDAAYWTGRHDEATAARERAYSAFEREGKDQQAALMALTVAEAYKYGMAAAVSRAWAIRAVRLVGDARGTAAYGYLKRFEAVQAFEDDGQTDRGLELAQEVIDMGIQLGDRSLEALGLQDKGRFMVALGRVEEGMALVDDAMVAAVSGETTSMVTGRSYCNMLAVCDQVADYQRASEWSQAAEAWCEQHSDSAYPGVCRIFRAELKGLSGDWQGANSDLDRALTELGGYVPLKGAALDQKGEWAVRAGRFEDAEGFFRQAYESGGNPMPGLAELRLRQGRAEEALELLEDRMPGADRPLERARLLPTLIDVQLALGNVSEAQTGADELVEVADLCGSSAMRAGALHAGASIAMEEDRTEDAVRLARSAVETWTSLQMPYEAATTRLVVASALEACGNAGAARLERDVAMSALQRLGAAVDEDAPSGS